MNRKMTHIVRILITGVLLLAISGCATQRPESPYYLSKRDAHNRQEKKIVESYNQLVADYTTVLNDEGAGLTANTLNTYSKNLKDFAERVGSATLNKEISYGLSTKIKNNLRSMGTDLVKKVKEKLPIAPDLAPMMKGLMEL
ncbi:MAG: hypothetical protein K6D57_07515 [Paludibacteraceae bacterium]|nr:hypothetical protein [Paludibacteraceae bacterium]